MDSVLLKLSPLLLGVILGISPLGKRLTVTFTKSMENGVLHRIKPRNSLLKLAFHFPLFIAFFLCDLCIGYIISQYEDFTVAYILALVIFALVFLVLISLEKANAYSKNR